MLSYNTIVAIQLLHVLQKFKHCPMNVTELKQKCLLHDVGNCCRQDYAHFVSSGLGDQ